MNNFLAIEKYKPQDATTNPTLIFSAAQLPKYEHLVNAAINLAKEEVADLENLQEISLKAYEHLLIEFGCEILKIVPGRVSTEVRACLSYDTDGTVSEARDLINMYEARGISRDRVLIKVASTWEGIEAARRLESEFGIHCNLTLLFNLAQAIACAQAGVTLVSPFVGRILDWYKKAQNREFTAVEDPGVLSVKAIYCYFKKFKYRTVIMGASFRNVGEIEELAGIDYLTISPTLLEQLASSDVQISCKLSATEAEGSQLERISMDRSLFNSMMEADPMASELLREGIKKFDEDSNRLVNWIRDRISQN